MACSLQKTKILKIVDWVIYISVTAIFLEILGIIVFYTTNQDVLNCKIWNHGTYNIAYQRCDKPTHKMLVLFQKDKPFYRDPK